MGEQIARRVRAQAENVVLDRWCNKCGRTVKDHPALENQLHCFFLSGGWGGRFPADMEEMRFHVCDDCLEAWVGTFQDPNVSINLYEDIEAVHSETGEAVLVEVSPVSSTQALGWAYRPGHRLDGIEDDGNLEDLLEKAPKLGVYRHFKSQFYEVLGTCLLMPEAAPVVFYRALYEGSRHFVRPLSMWSEVIARGSYVGPRFSSMPV